MCWMNVYGQLLLNIFLRTVEHYKRTTRHAMSPYGPPPYCPKHWGIKVSCERRHTYIFLFFPITTCVSSEKMIFDQCSLTFQWYFDLQNVLGNMNSEKYINVLDEYLWPVVTKHLPTVRWTLQEDNAPCHVSVRTTQWKRDCNVNEKGTYLIFQYLVICPFPLITALNRVGILWNRLFI
jgi:hypothetical protein